MKKYILLILGVFCVGLLQAQIEFEERYEQEYDWQKDGHLVIPNQEEGLLILQTDIDVSAKRYPMYLKYLDQRLEKVWEDTVNVPSRFFVKGYAYTRNNNFILFQNDNGRAIKVIQVNTETKATKEFESKDIAELQITEFEVIRNTVILGGYFQERPVVFTYNLTNDRLRTLQNVYQNQSDLFEIKINNDSLSFNVVTGVQDEKKDKSIVVSTYDYEGNPLREYSILPKPEYDLLSGASSSINDISQVVIGMYGYKSSYTASGIYINYIDRTGQQTMKYYNFGELPRFLDHEGEKRSKKLKNKAISMKTDGKEMRFKTSANMRKLREQDGKLIFQGEFYRTYARANRANLPNVYVRSLAYNDFTNHLYRGFASETSFEPEHEVTHAYSLVTDQQGNIQWDDYMQIDETISGFVDDFGSFVWFGDRASYAYYWDEELMLKSLSKAGGSETLVTELALKNEGDEMKIEKPESLGVMPWFDNKVLVYGVHHVKPEDRKESMRKVFFINKVTLTGEPIPAAEN